MVYHLVYLLYHYIYHCPRQDALSFPARLSNSDCPIGQGYESYVGDGRDMRWMVENWRIWWPMWFSKLVHRQATQSTYIWQSKCQCLWTSWLGAIYFGICGGRSSIQSLKLLVARPGRSCTPFSEWLSPIFRPEHSLQSYQPYACRLISVRQTRFQYTLNRPLMKF